MNIQLKDISIVIIKFIFNLIKICVRVFIPSFELRFRLFESNVNQIEMKEMKTNVCINSQIYIF